MKVGKVLINLLVFDWGRPISNYLIIRPSLIPLQYMPGHTLATLTWQAVHAHFECASVN